MPTLPDADPMAQGPVPTENQPGHHPPVEQDKPTGPPPTPGSRTREFAFAFDPLFRLPALAAGVTPDNAVVEVDGQQVRVRFGTWRMEVDRDNITEVTATGPYLPWKVIGPPHLSFKDRGITFATNRKRGVCMQLAEPLPGIEPTGRIKHPAVTVTVAEPDQLVELLSR
ncbi:MAG: hypothetical protein Q8K58_01535 [Acidimicrobiales bacterium]|nr:hypothetical protein [Acidimicrobiales bacterium]